MGQYYCPTIMAPDGRILTITSNDFGSGAKLTEHSWIGNTFVNAAYSLIYKSQKRVAWIGDYSCDEYETYDEAYTKAMPFDQFKKYYDASWGEDCEGLPVTLFSKKDLAILDYGTKRMFLVNHEKHRYIDMTAYIRDNITNGGLWDGWCMNPLPLLTACGNGRGGGDFCKGRIGYQDIGIWAFDYLEYTDKLPVGYSEAIFYFDENKEATA